MMRTRDDEPDGIATLEEEPPPARVRPGRWFRIGAGLALCLMMLSVALMVVLVRRDNNARKEKLERLGINTSNPYGRYPTSSTSKSKIANKTAPLPVQKNAYLPSKSQTQLFEYRQNNNPVANSESYLRLIDLVSKQIQQVETVSTPSDLFDMSYLVAAVEKLDTTAALKMSAADLRREFAFNLFLDNRFWQPWVSAQVTAATVLGDVSVVDVRHLLTNNEIVHWRWRFRQFNDSWLIEDVVKLKHGYQLTHYLYWDSLPERSPEHQVSAALFEEILAPNPKSPEARLDTLNRIEVAKLPEHAQQMWWSEKIQLCIVNRQYQAGEKLVRDYIKLHPEGDYLKIAQARFLAEAGQIETAWAIIEPIEKRLGFNIDIGIVVALCEAKKNKTKTVELCAQLLKMKSDHTATLFEIMLKNFTLASSDRLVADAYGKLPNRRVVAKRLLSELNDPAYQAGLDVLKLALAQYDQDLIPK